jgi:hypothetical protein
MVTAFEEHDGKLLPPNLMGVKGLEESLVGVHWFQ